ncbi:MAG: tetratricopeptide repeat protein, partial [Chloroflexi bacterium]|nr:tetratricopeptide repeat protein [Chloroflexota bacterium]
MAHVPPLIQSNILTYRQDGQEHTLLVNTPGWFAWLTTASAFRFTSEYGSFTARKEQVKHNSGNWYWKAYRKQKNKLFSSYLGKSEALSLERLNMVAVALSRKSESTNAVEQQVTFDDDCPQESSLSSEYLSDFAHNTRGNVLTPLTPLIGREQQLQVVSFLLQRPSVRFVTLTGTAGVGKTRLALQVASELRNAFADGVFFVPLASIKDPDQVMPSIAQALGLWKTTDHPLEGLVRTYLQQRHVLLVLDNFEQVMEAASQLADLLACCPYLHLLVTSRAVLHIQGEYAFPVEPLVVPDLEQLPEDEQLMGVSSVMLFIERARAIQPGFQLTPANARVIAEICVRLDGLPLAIELAAARIKLLPPQALLKRLSHRLEVLVSRGRDIPTRQQTLRDTLQWSYDLLSTEEQRLFRLLSVFVGGCDVEAVAGVAQIVDNTGCAKTRKVFEGVASLLDKSLLCQAEYDDENPRLSLLETLREYGLTCLQECGESEIVRQAHALYYLQFAEKAASFLFGPEATTWFERLEREHENLRAALLWALEQERSGIKLAVRLSDALHRFWTTRGYLAEGSTFLEQILIASEGSEAQVRAQALSSAIALAWHQEDYVRLEPLYKEQFSLCQRLGDRHKLSFCLLAMAGIAFHERNYTQSRSLAEQALVLSREQGLVYDIATNLMFLGRIASAQGDYARAEAFLQESLAVYRTLGYQGDVAWPLIYLARNAIMQGEHVYAHTLLEEALSLCREVGYKWGMAHALGFLGMLTLEQHNYLNTHALLTESLRLNQEVGNQRSIAWSTFLLANALASQKDAATASRLYEQSLNIAIALEHQGLIRSCLNGMAEIMVLRRKPNCAAQLRRVAETTRQGKITSLPQILHLYAEQTHTTTHTFSRGEVITTSPASGQVVGSNLVSSIADSRNTYTALNVRHSSPAPAQVSRQTSFSAIRLTAREMEVLHLVAQGL